MLKAEGSYILPDNVPSNEFLNLEGDKISTSRNWAVWLNEYLVDFPGKQDVLRYVLTANAPETKDNDFTWADFQARNNNELVAIYGIFVNRALVLTKKYFDGKVPAVGVFNEYDQATIAEFQNVKAGDAATINQLSVLSNIESLNAELIKQNIAKEDRLSILHRTAKEQLTVLIARNSEQNFTKLASEDPNLIERNI